MKGRSRVYTYGINDLPYEINAYEIQNGKKKLIWQDGCYFSWKGVLGRIYDKNKTRKNLRTYQGCSLCSDWHYASNFKLWYDVYFVEGWQLDKDILVKGNREYGPDACAFLPPYLNNLFTDCFNNRGVWPVGVHKASRPVVKKAKQFIARCSDAILGRLSLGIHHTPEEAHAAWQKEKINQIQKAVDRFRKEPVGYRKDVEDALLKRIDDVQSDIDNNRETIKI